LLDEAFRLAINAGWDVTRFRSEVESFRYQFTEDVFHDHLRRFGPHHIGAFREISLFQLQHKVEDSGEWRRWFDEKLLAVTDAQNSAFGSRNEQEKSTKLVGQMAKRAGRNPKRSVQFTESAGKMWLNATEQSGKGKVTCEQLRRIASELDKHGYVPPAKYLERKHAYELKSYNSHHSNSKVGPITTWTELVDHDDKDHLRGMRRLLSRCAKRLGTSPMRLSGK